MTDLKFQDINLMAYNGISGFDNVKSINYNKLLEKVMSNYDKNSSLNNMDKNKVKNIKKSDILLGANEFLKYKWHETISEYSPDHHLCDSIIDGTDRFFGQLFTILETDFIINWFYQLNNNHGSIQLSFKKPESILVKLLIRGKTCDDLCRASYISNDFTHLFDSLQELSDREPYLDYWIEDDRGKTNWNAVKIYLYSNKKSIYGKYIGFELQLVTPEMYIVKSQSNNHINYERMRLARDSNVLDLYKKHNVDFNSMCKRFYKLSDTMKNLMDLVEKLGNFIEVKGQFLDNSSPKTHEILLKHKESSLFLDDLENDSLVFGSYQAEPKTKFQIINGKLLCIGSFNHYLSKQKIKLEPLTIKIDFIGDAIGLQYSPMKECGVMNITEGQTIYFVEKKKIWIRNKIYNENVLYLDSTPFIHDDRLVHQLVVTVKDDVTSYVIDGKEIIENITLNGSGILEKNYFHLGFCCWDESLLTTILNVEINKFS